MRFILSILFLLLALSLTQVLASDINNKTFYIYQDADISIHNESAKAIQQGIEVAFSEVNNEVSGYKIAFKYLDHRGNVIRSKRNYQTFIDDPNGLVIFSGIHSPPLIKNRTFINENKALTLVPWAAGGPITRHPSKENWVFRLSVDDTQASDVIVGFAMNNQQCKRPHLLLEESPWGESNLTSMSAALKHYDIVSPDVTFFNWSIKAKGARLILNNIKTKMNDCILLVANASDGVVLINELHSLGLKEALPVISHWGITGGDFHEVINKNKRKNLELHFIQSCFSFTNEEQTVFTNRVFYQLKKHTHQSIVEPKDLKSAVGFIHAYDLTKLLIQAMNKVAFSDDIVTNRNLIRQALENINTPVQGLVKTYNKPFTIFDSANNKNAHEALNKTDYCMGHYGLDNEILITNE